MQNMDLRTGLVTRGPLRRVVRTVGVVDFDETALTDVTTKFKGWVEKLYVDSTGQQVHRGDPLFEIYSPELYSAQVEYLLALNQPTNLAGASTRALQASALAKLKFLDMPDEQIAQIRRDGQGEEDPPASTRRATGLLSRKMVVEGQMVEAGMKLYRLADLGTVWVQSQVYEQDLPFVRLGQEATVSLSYLPDRKFRGRVTYVYPTVDEKTRTAKVRMEFHNPGLFPEAGHVRHGGAQRRIVSRPRCWCRTRPSCAAAKRTPCSSRWRGASLSRARWRSGLRAEGDLYQVLSGLKRGRTGGDFGPVHARFGEPIARGDPEDARAQ